MKKNTKLKKKKLFGVIYKYKNIFATKIIINNFLSDYEFIDDEFIDCEFLGKFLI